MYFFHMLLDCNLLEIKSVTVLSDKFSQQPPTQFIVALIYYWTMCVLGGVACRSMSHDWHNNN